MGWKREMACQVRVDVQSKDWQLKIGAYMLWEGGDERGAKLTKWRRNGK